MVRQAVIDPSAIHESGTCLVGATASSAIGRNPGSATKVLVQSILSIAFAEAIVFYTLFLVK